MPGLLDFLGSLGPRASAVLAAIGIATGSAGGGTRPVSTIDQTGEAAAQHAGPAADYVAAMQDPVARLEIERASAQRAKMPPEMWVKHVKELAEAGALTQEQLTAEQEAFLDLERRSSDRANVPPDLWVKHVVDLGKRGALPPRLVRAEQQKFLELERRAFRDMPPDAFARHIVLRGTNGLLAPDMVTAEQEKLLAIERASFGRASSSPEAWQERLERLRLDGAITAAQAQREAQTTPIPPQSDVKGPEHKLGELSSPPRSMGILNTGAFRH